MAVNPAEHKNESAVASLCYVAAQFADDRRLAELVGDLSMNSVEFAQFWADHSRAQLLRCAVVQARTSAGGRPGLVCGAGAGVGALC